MSEVAENAVLVSDLPSPHQSTYRLALVPRLKDTLNKASESIQYVFDSWYSDDDGKELIDDFAISINEREFEKLVKSSIESLSNDSIDEYLTQILRDTGASIHNTKRAREWFKIAVARHIRQKTAHLRIMCLVNYACEATKAKPPKDKSFNITYLYIPETVNDLFKVIVAEGESSDEDNSDDDEEGEEGDEDEDGEEANVDTDDSDNSDDCDDDIDPEDLINEARGAGIKRKTLKRIHATI
tara:strand:+ start:75 stop:797 length:723 start_codon:yes stop_codon:yes gene_type:complete